MNKKKRRVLLTYECGYDEEWCDDVFYTKKAVINKAKELHYKHKGKEIFVNEYRGSKCLTVYVLEVGINSYTNYIEWKLLPIEETIESDEQLTLW